jgi:phosphoenolpyruvate carboxykinase (GTP)
VVEARDWEHGVYLGATISSERTAAAEGTLGELRRDPFAMAPFCGYNMADHWAHWLSVGAELRKTGSVPRVFQVNWFRKGADGRFLWPGFGENSRVIEWILERVDGQVPAQDSPIGLLPTAGSLNVDGLDVSEADLAALFAIDRDSWLAEVDATAQFFDTFEGRVPDAVTKQLASLRERLTA